MPLARKPLWIAGLGVAAIASGIGLAWWLTDDDEALDVGTVGEGAVLCPLEIGHMPADTAGIHEGDFVVVQLVSGDRSFSEPTWATVVSLGPDSMVVRIAGEQLATGIRPLATKRHGFRLGDKLIIGRDCVFDVFVPSAFAGQILCGPALGALDDVADPDFRPVAPAMLLQAGDRAKVVVGSKEAFGTAWWEPLWTRITRTSPTGQVLTAIIDEDPEISEHGLRRGSVVRYNRDCVVEV